MLMFFGKIRLFHENILDSLATQFDTKSPKHYAR